MPSRATSTRHQVRVLSLLSPPFLPCPAAQHPKPKQPKFIWRYVFGSDVITEPYTCIRSYAGSSSAPGRRERRPRSVHDEHLVERQAAPGPRQFHRHVPRYQPVSPQFPVAFSGTRSNPEMPLFLSCAVCVTVCTHGFDWVGFQDFLFNNGGLSVAFIFETDWLPEREAAVFSR
jgi:hypothetical protein